MKVIILAAGRGSRMGDRTSDRPKCLCVLAKKTLLQRCLETLYQAGIEKENIGIVTGYKKELFEEKGIKYFHNEDWEETNMFVSLTKADEWLSREECIVCYSDIVFTSNAIHKLVECRDEMALTYYTEYWELWNARMENPLDDLETFILSKNKKYLMEIGNRPESKEQIEGQYMGLIRFTPRSWEWVQNVIKKKLSKPIEKLDMTTLINELIKAGHLITAIPNSDFWLECDTGNDICIYEDKYKDKLEEM